MSALRRDATQSLAASTPSMSAASGHPQKTELGLDELRRRTRGLSQRHRTMLLLVNGKRERREVLTLAGQAGVGVEFFDELVAMGMVDPAPQANVVVTSVQGKSADAIAERVFAAASEWPDTGPGVDAAIAALSERIARGEPKLPVVTPEAAPAAKAVGSVPAAMPAAMPRSAPPAAVVVESRAEARAEPPTASAASTAPNKAAAVVHASTASGPPRPKRAAPPVLTLNDAVPLAATRAPARKAAEPALPRAVAVPKPVAARVEPQLPPAPEPTGARMRFGAAAPKPKALSRRAPPVELRQEPRLTPVKPPGRPARIKMLAPAGPLDDDHEQQLLAEVRSLLIGTLLVDGPVTSSLTALRVRKARSRYDLTALVWEIERTLVRARRPREAQSRLSKARDLLGLGNTVVDEETGPGEHTRPGERTRPQR
jgi:hypothetical protein